MGAGIDYGMGQTNIDKANGIRYGVIHANEVGQAWFDSAEAEYGDPTCPKCGNPVAEYDEAQHGECEIGHLFSNYSRISCGDYACEICKHVLAFEECFGDEPIGFVSNDDGYEAYQSGGGTDIFITKSPFYTYAPFCSPCAPGAGYLGSADGKDETSGVKTYCLGHDWFEDGKAPYRVFKVKDDSEVFPS